MKLIDEKGRLFGFINIIDFLVLLFLIALGAGVFHVSKIFTNPKVSVENEILQRKIRQELTQEFELKLSEMKKNYELQIEESGNKRIFDSWLEGFKTGYIEGHNEWK